jgi:hypothetical protein
LAARLEAGAFVAKGHEGTPLRPIRMISDLADLMPNGLLHFINRLALLQQSLCIVALRHAPG